MTITIERLDQITNPQDKELVALLQDLVRIPSWVDKTKGGIKHNENGVVDYLECWLKTNTNFSVRRQKLDGDRYNLIASKGRPEVIFLGHTDTVAPSEGSKYNQFAAEIHDGKIWGRGSTDMKSGIAAMVQALSLSPNVDNIWAMFYADEEYDFLGMKGLVRDYSDLKPGLLVSSDGSNLEIGHGCRGLIDFRARVRGTSGHAAHGNGINAINGLFSGLTGLRNYLDRFNHPVMGGTSLNLAYFLGGQQKEGSINQDDLLEMVAQEGNVIPDIAECVVDIRPASPDLTVENITSKLKADVESTGCTLEKLRIRHDLGAWYTDLSQIKEYLDLAAEVLKQKEVKINGLDKSGYLDLQMLWAATGKPPAFMFGGGVGFTAHKPDEHIEIENLIKERDFFQKVLNKKQ